MQHNAPADLDAIAPYPFLYIYYLSGRLPAGGRCFGPSFIGNWQEAETSFLFFSEPADDAVKAVLSDKPEIKLNDRFEMSYEDWHGGPVLPFRAGRFVVMPPWAKAPVGSHDVPVLLDPGVVFGAGNHPTTRDCLSAIDALMASETIGAMLDLGAGTGLLAIAAAKLGADSTIAVDNNFLAAATTLNNIRYNQLTARVLSVAGNAEDFIDYPADLVVANIHYDVMKQLLENQGFKQKKWFILSGLMRSQARQIKNRIAGCRAEILEEWIQDGIWYTILGRIKPGR